MTQSIELPNRGEAYEWAGIQYLLSKEFGRQFFNRVDEKFQALSYPNWFQQVMERRAADKQPIYDDPADPRFLLKEALYYKSPLRQALPELDSEWDQAAKKLSLNLNQWSHQKANPTADTFLDLLVRMEDVSIRLGLAEFLDVLNSQISRARAILNGTWVPEGPRAAVPEEATRYAEDVTKKLEEVKLRPPVGHEWIGEPGTRIVKLDLATRDVTENGASIKSELGADADAKITSWLRYYPLGGRLRIDTDGAVLGFKQGVGYLIGWLGEEPGVDHSESRGFFLPHEYEFVPTDIRDVQTGELLSQVAREPIDWILNRLVVLEVPFNAVLNMTIYGDLVFTTEAGSEKKVVNVHKDVWFPGQLVRED